MNNPFRLKKQSDDMEAAEIASLFGEPPVFEKKEDKTLKIFFAQLLDTYVEVWHIMLSNTRKCPKGNMLD